VLLEDLEACAVRHVIAAGRLVGPDLFGARAAVAPIGLDSVKLDSVGAEDFRTPASGPSTQVIGVVPGRIITTRVVRDLPVRDGVKAIDLASDTIRVAVVARHGKNRNIGRGFVTGFGLTQGAIASSVGHDSHNICVVGADDHDMAVAVNRLIALQGGFVVAQGGAVRAEMALPFAGLMSLASFEAVRAELIALRAAAKALGCTLPEPFLQIAFLPLPVIPHLKITDFGMFDVDRFELIPA
jgi:adenine deaminase